MSHYLTGKRFSALIIFAGLLTVGLFVGRPELYPIYAGTLGTMYGVFAAGQSWTDVRESQAGKS